MQRSLSLPAGGLGRCKVLEGVHGSEPTEAPKIQEFLAVNMGCNGIAHNSIGNCLENVPRTEKRFDVLLQYYCCLYNR